MLAGMPRQENAQLHNIHFVTCSNVASALDMASPVVADLNALAEGIDAYDACLQKEVLLIAPTLAVLADNPRHSELLNHLGGNAKKYCRMCMVSNCIMYTSYQLCCSNNSIMFCRLTETSVPLSLVKAGRKMLPYLK